MSLGSVKGAGTPGTYVDEDEEKGGSWFVFVRSFRGSGFSFFVTHLERKKKEIVVKNNKFLSFLFLKSVKRIIDRFFFLTKVKIS